MCSNEGFIIYTWFIISVMLLCAGFSNLAFNVGKFLFLHRSVSNRDI